ncbi:MAG: phosphatase PAP2 family protein [Pseudomonadales bacterium]|nr:phosphatase PAP2 family protein [Pseudomonadales bacterium]
MWEAGRSSTSAYFECRRTPWLARQSNDGLLVLLAWMAAGSAIMVGTLTDVQAMFVAVQQIALSVWPAPVWEHVTFLGDTLVAVTLLLLFTYRYPQLSLALLVAAFVGTCLVHGIKFAFPMPRPPAVLDDITVLGPVYRTASMPSGHTATAFIAAGLLVRCAGQGWKAWLPLTIASLVGISRMACGVHWPTDVLAGAAIGLVSAWCGLRVSDRLALTPRRYLLASSLMLVCAFLLVGHDGGFGVTRVAAACIAFGSTGYWVTRWTWQLLGESGERTGALPARLARVGRFRV